MKKGFSRYLLLTSAILVIQWLCACANFLGGMPTSDVAGADFDRGYEAPPENSDGNSNGLSLRDESNSEEGGTNPFEVRVRDAIDARDVVLGMTRSQVLQSWGEPSSRDVAGDGQGGHERWHYGSRYTLGGDRVVIFEGGKVAGWYR